MLDDAMSPVYRNAMLDDVQKGWVYSWHCVDHVGYANNPRRKAIGYGKVFEMYKRKLSETGSASDELNWHFHPLSFSRDPLQCATSYINSYDVLIQILCRRLIDEAWYPMVNRPGFHSERPDSHAFLEQWIPYDYANQSDSADNKQPDLSNGRLGDWRRAPKSWRGYHPHHDDYQMPGNCRRWSFRCMNVGTRIRTLTLDHVEEAFREAEENGSAILAFADHDYRDIRPDVAYVRQLLSAARPKYPHVTMRFSGALAAARAHTQTIEPTRHSPLALQVELQNNALSVRIKDGVLFGSQPFLALKTKGNEYHHDNLDVQIPGKLYTYALDAQTILPHDLAAIGVGAAGRDGSCDVKILKF